MVEKIRVSGMKERQKLNKRGIGKEITNTLSGKEASRLLKSLLQSKAQRKENSEMLPKELTATA